MHFSKLALVAIASLALSVPAQSQTITDLYNTGVDGSGTPLATNGIVDTHWTNGAAGTAFTALQAPYYPYTDATFITIDANSGYGSYTATFNTTFTLPSNVDLSTVSITGNFSVDNFLDDILINGHSTGSIGGGFSTPNPFTLPTGFYQTGTNTLGVVWSNTSGPGAIAVEFTSKSFGTTTAVPEPGSVALLVGMGLSSAGFLVRRRRADRLTA